MRTVVSVMLAGCAAPLAVERVTVEPQVLPAVACVETRHAASTPPPEAMDYSSNWGLVRRVDSTAGHWYGAYPNGVLVCTDVGTTTTCEWYEGMTAGHATFTRSPTGELAGTWGNGASNRDGGDWTLVPITRSSGGVSGVWETNWGDASITTSGARAHVTYRNGTMECDLTRVPQLECNWVEGSLSGGAQLVVESDHVMRGRWGTGPSSTDGGEWIFVRR